MNELPSHLNPQNQNIIASILLAEIAGYADRPIFEQIELTARMRQMLERVVSRSTGRNTVSIDREDSLVLLFTGDPRDCLEVTHALANLLESSADFGTLPVRIGVNLGSVTIARGAADKLNVSGAGIDDAERVARAGLLREILLSRAYYTVLSRTSMDEGLLRHKSFISDELDHSFAVYQIARPVAKVPIDVSVPIAALLARKSTHNHWGAYVAVAMVAVGGALIYYDQISDDGQFMASTPQIAAASVQAIPSAKEKITAATEPAATSVNVQTSVLVAPGAMPVATAKDFSAKAAAPRTATLQLAIKPWGEVYVDGKRIGVTPPLHEFKVPPGKREIIVRNSDFLPFQTTLDIQPESLLQISHRFDQ